MSMFRHVDTRRRWHRAAVLLSCISLPACETTDPATRQPKVSEAASRGTEGAVGGALICGLSAAVNGGDGRQIARDAALCSAVAGSAGAANGMAEDERDRQLLAEFRDAGLVVKIRGANLLLNSSSAITFAADNAFPDGSSASLLGSVAKILNRFPHRAVEVIGHTSADEPDSLSLGRARAVASILARNGVQSRRIWTSGRGDSEPIVPGVSPVSAYRNRRVEIFFLLVN